MTRPAIAALGLMALGLMASLAGCSSSKQTETVHADAVEHGRALFDDPKASPSVSNVFACGTCHRSGEASSADISRLDPGAPLGGVTMRRSFWGGARVDLLEAINDCRSFFMDSPAPWTTDDEDARAMYAFLAQLGPAAGSTGAGAPVPFTIVQPVDLPPGDPTRGAAAFELACKQCHGSVHDGANKLAEFIPALPDEVLSTHGGLTPVVLRNVFIGKARAGAFRGGGSMPPFSSEVLSDADLAGIVAYFGLY
jgi:mono/diheme cytochrome c family protein